MSGAAEVEALVSIISKSTQELLQSSTFAPSLRALSDTSPPPPPFLDPKDESSKAHVIAAALQLVATLQGASLPLDLAMSLHKSSALRVAVECHVAEAIRESKSEGLHVSEIAKASTIDPSKLARLLRYLTTLNLFREVAPDVFANTSTSVGLDTGKSIAELTGNKFYFDGTNGIVAVCVHTADDVMKAGAYLTETLLEAKNATKTGLEVALGATAWEYFAKPENEDKLQRFGIAMSGQTAMEKIRGSLFKGYPYKDLPKDSLIVDVGGGIGSVSAQLVQAIPHLKIVVQDLPEVINKDGKAFWAKEAPESIESGRVKLQPHDFFTKQPVENADLFMLRTVIHDWDDEKSIQILSHLAEAAKVKGTAKLLLSEHAIDYLCPADKLPKFEDAKMFGSPPEEFAPPLLPRFAGATPLPPYFIDMQMMTAVGAQERTLGQYATLGSKAGWKLEEVYQGIPGGRINLLFGLAK